MALYSIAPCGDGEDIRYAPAGTAINRLHRKSSNHTMSNLKSVSITFNTHDGGRDANTILHVFVKNRRSSSATPEYQTTYIANDLEEVRFRRLGLDPFEFNPYLASARNLSAGVAFLDPSSHTFNLPLRLGALIPVTEIVLPVVDVHILPKGNNRWIFDYTVSFLFDDGNSFSASSNTNGVTGIILDQDNRDSSSICVENKLNPQPPAVQPVTTALLTSVTLQFATHNGGKDIDTQVDIHIVNRLSATSSRDMVVARDILTHQEFLDPSVHQIVFPSSGFPLASGSIRLHDIVLPEININITPKGDNRWIFDFQVIYFFDNGQWFTSNTYGIILDQDNHKYTGVYQGSPFPTVTPPQKPLLAGPPVNHLDPAPKIIPLSYLQTKLNEFINNRQGQGSQDPPLTRLRIDNSGVFGSTLPESYFDVLSIEASPTRPGTILPPGSTEAVTYDSNPTSLGQEGFRAIAGAYFSDINSQRLTVTVDPTNLSLPLAVEVDFETGGATEIIGVGAAKGTNLDLTAFSIKLGLTLEFDFGNHKIDVMSWIDEINDLVAQPAVGSGPQQFSVVGTFGGQPVDVSVSSVDDFKQSLLDRALGITLAAPGSVGPLSLASLMARELQQKILARLTEVDPFTNTSKRDSINSLVNSWLLGGVVQSGNPSPVPFPDPCLVRDLKLQGTNLVISYTGPQHTFQAPVPPGWPSGTTTNPAFDFSPGTLANIDHIVVLTMENRSFDHMLGYLSLPPARGGMGRTDVDGLKGTEFNLLNGVKCPSFAFAAGDTVFSPDPPHSFEPVNQAINGGRMDGFAQSYGDAHGVTAGPRIMGYHTAANLPAYDALARDFAICQRWFAPHPGPTFCNRFYELTGRLNIDPYGFWEFSNSNPLRPVFTQTIFDFLTAQNVSWKYFEKGYCFLRFFEGHTFDSTNIATFDDPEFGFAATAAAGRLPSVTFIDPHFIELPPGGNCDGPPADVSQGQLLVQQVVDAVVASPTWNKTLLIITYDEHGGFFDHVPPPPATKVSPESLGTYGVRVPAFLVSPWVKAGSVFGTDAPIVQKTGPAGPAGDPTAATPGPKVTSAQHFDHTSILKTIAKRFMSKNPPYLGPRFADALDLSPVVGNELSTPQFLPFIGYNFVYAASRKRLEVKGGAVTPGVILWQNDPNTTVAQDFSFEDAGNGFVYIRTHTGGLYVTVDVPPGTVSATAPPLGIKQDVKYQAGGVVSTNSPDFQRWKLSASIQVNSNEFTISNAAFPGKVLQPSGNSTASGVAIVLGPPLSGSALCSQRIRGRFRAPASCRWRSCETLMNS